MCTNLADHLAPPCHKNMPKKRPQLLRFIAETQKTIGKSGRPILVHPPVDHPNPLLLSWSGDVSPIGERTKP